MYRELSPQRIADTAEQLRKRIQERFPGSGLGQVAGELTAVARESERVSLTLSQPIASVRIIVGITLLILVATLILGLSLVKPETREIGFAEAVQAVEAGINDLVFVGVAAYFLIGIERRIKRHRALQALHVLRSFAHVVDMHQLTKDPDALGADDTQRTTSSPERNLTAFQTARYLDYSSELLAIISKIAALYVQRFDDSEALRAAGDIEDLTVGLSRNIWQKIMILDRVSDDA